MGRIIYILPDADMNRTVDSMRGVQAVVKAKAEEVGGVAKFFLDTKPKHRTFKARIEVNRVQGDRYRKYDYFVQLVDDTNETGYPGNALAIEFGHFYGKRGRPNRKYVEGLHIMEDTFFAVI